MQVIDVMATVREAFGFVNRHLSSLVAVALIPCALNFLLLIADYAFADGGGTLSGLLFFLLSAAVNVPFLTAWHRLTLLGPDRARPVVRYAFRPAEIRFLGYALLFYGALYVAMILVPFIVMTIGVTANQMGAGPVLWLTLFLTAAVVLSLLFLRASLVFPAAAIGRPLTVADSWRRTTDNVWAMFFVMAFVLLPLLAIGLMFQLVVIAAATVLFGAADMSAGMDYVLLAALAALLLAPSYYFTAAFVSALSLMFGQLTGYDPASFKLEDITRR